MKERKTKKIHVGSHRQPLMVCFALSIECSSFILKKTLRFALQYNEICYFICKNLINKSCLNEWEWLDFNEVLIQCGLEEMLSLCFLDFKMKSSVF